MVNVWPNSDFETSTEPWEPNTGSDIPILSTVHAADGYCSLFCRRGAGTGSLTARALASDLLPGAGEYSLLVQVWVPSSAGGTNGFRVDGSGTTTQLVSTDVRDDWAELSIDFSWDGVGAVWFRAYGSDATSELWMDQLTVDDGTPPDDDDDDEEDDAQGGGAATGQALLTFEGLDLVSEPSPRNPFQIADEDWWFEAAGEEFDFGDPERAVTEIVSQLIEGSVAAFGDTGNRTASFKLRAVSPTSLGLTLAERSLVMACDTVGLKTLAYTHPDNTSPTTVFDVILADAAFEYDDLDELRCYRTWTMTLTCKPWSRSANQVTIAATNIPGEQPPEPPADAVIEDGTYPSHFAVSYPDMYFNYIGQMVAQPSNTKPSTKGRGTANGSSLTWKPPNEFSPGWKSSTPMIWARLTYGREVMSPERARLTVPQGTRKPYIYRTINTDLSKRPFIIIEGVAVTWSANYARGVYKVQHNTKYYRYSGLGGGTTNYKPDLEFRIAGQVVKPVQFRWTHGNGAFRAVLSGAGVRNASTIGFASSINTNYDVTEAFLGIDTITLSAGKGSTVDGRMQARSLAVPGSKAAEASLRLLGYDSAGTPASLGRETLLYSSAADDTDFQPPLTAYRTAGPIRTTDNSALSRAWNTMTTSVGQTADDFCDTYKIPVDQLTPGTYQVLASLKAAPNADGPHAIKTDATLMLAGTSGWPWAWPGGGRSNSSVTVDLVYEAWRIRPIGALTLPLLAAEIPPAGMTLRLRAWANDGLVRHDTLLLCNISTGDVTILDTSDNGTLKVVGVRLDAATSQAPVQTAWIEYSDGSVLQAGPRLIAPGVHSLTPPAAELFTITAGNAYATVGAEFYPRWATYVVGSPADLDIDETGGDGGEEEPTIPQGAVSGEITWAGQARGLTHRSGRAEGAVIWAGTATGKMPEAPSFVATFNVGDTELGTPMAATLYLGNIASMVVDWGDAQTSDFASSTNPVARSHTYDTPGVYQVRIWGNLDKVGAGLQTVEEMSSLISVDTWTTASRTRIANFAFRHAVNLTHVAEPPPTVIEVISMFREATRFNDATLSDWDVSNVTNMNSMFYGAAAFSQDLSGWDVSNVTSHSLFATGSALTPEQLPHWPDEAV